MIFPLSSHPKLRKEPKLREVLSPPAKSEASEKSKPLADALVEELSSLCRAVSKIRNERETLRLEKDKLKFGLQYFAGSDDDIHFYTGFPNYSTLISFYKSLLPAATQLCYVAIKDLGKNGY